jgi:4-hydroxy-2-oxovalerate aldolase
MTRNPKVDILDCTIRDGSYLINYQFTAEDTYLITSALCGAGLERIEVGHGLGLGAQDRGKGAAAALDVSYIEAGVAASAGRAEVGVFYIPGIGTLDNIRQAADAGLGFIRIGTNIDQYAQGETAIALAKKLGLEVWANLMKSYALPSYKFAEICKCVEDLGVDVAVLVDSAGGMVPEQIKAYTQEALKKVTIPLGFHGHNNLDLVIANCLAFVMAGGSMVDTSLRGMGRSAGNAATEVVGALLSREGYDIGPIDFRQLMRLAENLIAPGMPRDAGLQAEEIASGIALFHSSFQGIVDAASAKVGVEPFEVILELPKESQFAVTPKMAFLAAERARRHHDGTDRHIAADDQWVHRASCTTLEELRDTLRVLAAKTSFTVVMSMARPRGNNAAPLRIAPVRVGHKYCIGHVESASPEHDAMVWECFRAEVGNWMVDRQITPPQLLPPGTYWLPYDDDHLLITALDDLLRIVSPTGGFYIPDSDDPLTLLALKWLGTSAKPPCDVGLALDSRMHFGLADSECVRIGGKLIIAQSDAVSPNVLQIVRERDIEVWRLDMGEALLAEVARTFNTRLRFEHHGGKRIVGGVRVVAGGMVGDPGDIVVNSISQPSIILGKADGKGGVLPLSDEDWERRRQILEWIGGQGATKA